MAITDAIGIMENLNWNDFVEGQINALTKQYKGVDSLETVLKKWHKDLTINFKHAPNFSPHVNGFYMIFMTHGTWYKGAKKQSSSASPTERYNLSNKLQKDVLDSNNSSHMNFMATDIDIPDINEEFISVSSRIRNSFIPSRNYFVSDFNITYIDNNDLAIMRYHEMWMKSIDLIKRGEFNEFDDSYCKDIGNGYFLDMPYSNAVWVAVFKPFTMQIQLLIKLIGVMPVTLPLKQVVGNRSATKMTVLNIAYKSSDMQYKFYEDLESFKNDKGLLAESFRQEIVNGDDINDSLKEKVKKYYDDNGLDPDRKYTW